MRIRGRFAVIFAPSILLGWSCATDPAPVPRADVDPSIPEIDASWKPRPTRPVPVDEPAPPAPRGGEDASAEATADAALEPAPPFPGPELKAPRPALGELVITEVMYDPTESEPAGEWIEVYNAATTARSLGGLTLRDGADRTHVIVGEVVLAPGTYAVLARNQQAALAAGVPSTVIAYAYGAGVSDGQGILLANGASGAIAVADGTTELTRVAYGAFAFTDASGRSAQHDTTDASDATSWCSAEPTPGAATSCTRR